MSIKDSVEGHIQFNTPTIYRGIDFDEFGWNLKGKIIDATANSDASTESLNEILDSDDGARYIGEFAIGFNPYVTHQCVFCLTKNCGSFHFTLVNAMMTQATKRFTSSLGYGKDSTFDYGWRNLL